MKSIRKIFGSFRFSFLPPLMIYLAAGVSGLTSIVGLFFVKEYLDLSAAFLAGLGFGLDYLGFKNAFRSSSRYLMKFKSLLVVLGALVMGLSSLIMYFNSNKENEYNFKC